MDPVIEHFKRSLARGAASRELVELSAVGWQELCPTEESWRFTHPDHPDVIVCWSPGYEPYLLQKKVDWLA